MVVPMAKKPSVTVDSVRKSKEQAEAVLKAAGIEADYLFVLRDSGPEVEIQIDHSQYYQACQALPFTIGSATVKLVSRKRKK